MYTRQVFQRTPDWMMSKARWKVAGAFRRPNGMRLYQKVPMWLVKVVLS